MLKYVICAVKLLKQSYFASIKMRFIFVVNWL